MNADQSWCTAQIYKSRYRVAALYHLLLDCKKKKKWLLDESAFFLTVDEIWFAWLTELMLTSTAKTKNSHKVASTHTHTHTHTHSHSHSHSHKKSCRLIWRATVVTVRRRRSYYLCVCVCVLTSRQIYIVASRHVTSHPACRTDRERERERERMIDTCVCHLPRGENSRTTHYAQ